MIRRFGGETLSTYCQTLNGCDKEDDMNNNIFLVRILFSLCGPLLVSRTGDAG